MFVDFININVHDKDFYFPCYDWVSNGYVTPNSITALPQYEKNKALTTFRSTALLKEQSKTHWAKAEDIGSVAGHLTCETVLDLPRSNQWAVDRPQEELNKKVIGVSNLVLNKFLGVFNKFDSLEDVQKATDINNLKLRERSVISMSV